jgi:dipeptidyl aminopeptidase/acylaminoacyl peptidase
MRPYLLASVLFLPAVAPAQVVTPNENLVVDGVPAIPTTLAAEVRRYTESRAAFLVDWHPSRREILIGTRFANTYQLHWVKMPGGARTQLTFFDEAVGGGSYQPRDGSYFVFGKDVGGNEFNQLFRQDLADGKVTLLTDGGRSQNGGVVWSRGGDRIAYGSTRRNGADRDIYLMDPANPSSDRLVSLVTGGGWGVLDWSPDDRRLLAIERISVNRANLWLIDATSGTKTPLLQTGTDTVAYGEAKFSADGKGVYLTSDRGSEYQRLIFVDLATQRINVLTRDIPWDVESFDLSPDGELIALVTNEAGISRLWIVDAATNRRRAVDRLPAGVIDGVRWHRSGNELGFTVASARSTADVYSWTRATNQLTRWTESELGGLVAADLSEPTLISWKSFDGLDITGFYYKPPVRFSGKRPLIIDIHGGPEGQSRPDFLGRDNYFLNELGVAVILPNVRGSTGYGKTFVKLDNGMKRMDAVKDIGALLDWVARQPDLDPDKIMVTGGSYGGFMTLAVTTTYPDRIACALDVVGPSNFNTFLKNTEAYRRDLRRVEYGDERVPAMAAFLDKTAPLTNAGKITKPLFVVQGANDPRVPRTESEQMVAKVKQNGTPVWYLMAKDEGHGFRKKSNVDFQFFATVSFVRRYLLGSPPVGGAP